MRIKSLYFIINIFILISLLGCKDKNDVLSTEQLYTKFKNPEMQYRPFVRWWWNGDKVEADELKRELNLLKEVGIGGVEINPIAFPRYCDSVGKKSLLWLSPEWIDMLQVTFDEAKKLDMTCDLIVGSGWPFGAEILTHDERAKIVVNYAKEVRGPMTLTICQDSIFKKADPPISSPYKGKSMELIQLRLYPNPASNPFDYTDILPLSGDSIFEVTIPEGDYTIGGLVKVTGFLEVINGAPGAAGPVLNHFNTSAVNKYLDNMSNTIENQIGALKEDIRAMFTDSMELEGANWTEDMAEEFRKRYGYDLLDYLPFILFETGPMGSALNYKPLIPITNDFKDKVQRARYDFENFKAELMTERFTHSYQAWCRRLGVKSRAQAYGRGFFPLENAMEYDIPEGESWTTNWLRHKPGEEMSEKDYRRGRAYTMVNKFVSSAAHLAGNRMMSCEEMTNTYTVFNMTLEQLKIGGDQSAISGVTHSVFHGFNYSPNKEVAFPGWLRYGAFYSENNNWWKFFHLYNDYKARLSTALQNATMFADIAVLNPENDMWSTIGMQNEPFPNITRAPYKTFIWEAINKCGGGVDYITENIINRSTIKKGVIKFNNRKYNTLFIIDVESIHPQTAEQIKKFVACGGKVICIDTIPYKSLGLQGDIVLKDSIVKTNIEEAQKHIENFVFVEPPTQNFIPWYDSLMKAHNLPHYLDIQEPNPYVMQNRYTTDDGSEMIFICNSNINNAHNTKIRFNKGISKGKHPWIWDLHTGKRYRIYLDKNNSYDFDLGPADSYLVVFDKNKKGEEWHPISGITKNNKQLQSHNLTAGWDVEMRHSRIDTVIEAHFDSLIDLKDIEEYKHFTGTIIYRKTIDNREAGEVILDLGKVGGVAEVIVNQKSAGVQYFGRRIFDISNLVKEGENEIEIQVTTTMGNYMKSLKDNRIAQIYVNRKNREQEYQSMGLLKNVTIYY